MTEDLEQVPLAQQGEVAEEFLSGFFATLSTPISLTRTEDEEEQIVRVAVNGDNLGHLIGPRGTTLHSLQEITRTVVQRKTGTRSGRVVLDISGYREKRKLALEEFSQKIAAEVKETGELRKLEAMNPADRKIVHDTINGIDGVTTTSEGEEPRRYVVIQPENV